MINRFETYFDANYTYFTTLKSLGLFENLAFVIMSTRENIRLIARGSFSEQSFKHLLKEHNSYIKRDKLLEF